MFYQMKQHFLPIIFILISSFSLAGQRTVFYYYESRVEKGDGILSFMRRYNLQEYSCNFEKFYELNKIKKGSPLRADINYILPLMVYEYDGKSIRSSIHTKDLEQATRIKDFNDDLVKKKVKKQSFLKNKELWVPYSEIYCNPSANLKSSPKEMLNDEINNLHPEDYPIFGDKYRKVKKGSDKLKGQVYYIESGHGGPDPGAMAEIKGNIISEDEYAYDIALRVARLLVSQGAITYIVNRDLNDGIRDEKFLEIDNDEVCYGGLTIPLDQKKRLQQRANAINNLYLKHKKQGVKIQKALLIHVDSRNKSKRTDVFFYHQNESKESIRISKNMLAVFILQYAKHQRDKMYEGSISTRNLLMLRELWPPTVFVELGNIKNPQDQKRLLQYENRQLLAQWLYEGLIK
jgi:N-acetylmuramoyl-L-alanine amidase